MRFVGRMLKSLRGTIRVESHCLEKTNDFGGINPMKQRCLNVQVVAFVIKLSPSNMELVKVALRLDKLKFLLLDNHFTFEEVQRKRNWKG
ncbi:unnamed protein product, partial [Vitis vinifera]